MFVVIFKAEILDAGPDYIAMAIKLRDLAINGYGCKEFISSTRGNSELALSYWETQDQIENWKENTDHLYAQTKGASKWYKSYSVEVAEVVRAYHCE